MMTRRESDSIGTMDVPEKAYYGVQTLRAKNNFKITGRPLHPEFIKNLARIKKQRLTRIWRPMCWMKRKAMPS